MTAPRVGFLIVIPCLVMIERVMHARAEVDNVWREVPRVALVEVGFLYGRVGFVVDRLVIVTFDSTLGVSCHHVQSCYYSTCKG